MGGRVPTAMDAPSRHRQTRRDDIVYTPAATQVNVRRQGDDIARLRGSYWYGTAYPVWVGEFLMLITPRPNVYRHRPVCLRRGLNESAFVLITDSVGTIRKRFRSRSENEYTAIISTRYGISPVKEKGSTSQDSWIIR